MVKTHFIIPALAALLVFPFGCAREPVEPGPEEEVRVSLALSVGGIQQSDTKMSSEVTQHDMTPDSFRGIEQVFILPFKTGSSSRPIQPGDEPWDFRLALPQAGLDATFDNTASANRGLVYNNFSHLYNPVYFRPESDAVLVYGKAPDEISSIASKQHYGSLISPDFDQIQSTNEIQFSLEPIVPSDNSSLEYKAYNDTWKNKTIDFLNNILRASPTGKSQYIFNDPASYENHPGLTAALEDFTNKGIYFPLSAEVLGTKLTQLYRAVYPYASNKSNSANYYKIINGVAYAYVYELANAILTQIYDASITSSQNTYTNLSGSGTGAVITMKTNGPVSFGLPAGTIPIQWQEGQNKRSFRIVYNIDHYTGLGYIPADYICFPPSLWYFVNSPLISTEQEEVTQKYTSQYSWEAIQANYSSNGIGNRSKAAAIRDPLEYGVALLKLNVLRATTVKINNKETIKDFAGANIDVGNTKFPLTGIIIADQYPQRFDFTATTEEGAKMRYIYDPDMNDVNGNPCAWLSKTSGSSILTTLALPTRPGADVRFALEFQNKSGATIITGVNGCKIPPGQHFYLAGILKFSERIDNSGQNLGSVFVRDHITEIKASFNSLKAAYDVIPDLTDPQLQLGVQAEFGWNLSTPAIVPVVIQ